MECALKKNSCPFGESHLSKMKLEGTLLPSLIFLPKIIKKQIIYTFVQTLTFPVRDLQLRLPMQRGVMLRAGVMKLSVV
jgi:hypothetical protein